MTKNETAAVNFMDLADKINWELVSSPAKSYLENISSGYKSLKLEDIWSLMDKAWVECSCVQGAGDGQISLFYDHPVWLLNGLFIEQHELSKRHRRDFAHYISSLKPRRVADFGGGFGSLARMTGEICPEAEVHVIEPHPQKTAVALAEKTENVRYMPELQGRYDVLVATDVFEHVTDPLLLVESTAGHLRMNGQFVIANCFWPVILCHLPGTFHFRWSWAKAMQKMNLIPMAKVAYGRAFKKSGPVSAAGAREMERRSRSFFGVIECLPSRVRARASNLLWGFL